MVLPPDRVSYLCYMLTKEENDFLLYWSQKRLTGRKDLKEFIKGFSKGLLIGIAIIIAIMIGWYKRANMEINSQLSPFVFLIAIIAIGIFMAFIYQNYQWELKEQHYLELLNKKKKEETDHSMQQSLKKKSQ